jgi:hypothetical protein
MREGRNVYRDLVGRPKRKRPLARPRLRWEDGIKMDLREIGWGGGAWSGFTWLRTGTARRAVVNAVMNLRALASRNYYLGGDLVLQMDVHRNIFVLRHRVL